MDLYEGLLSRRSIRRFQDRQVPDDVIYDILKAAMYAPSAKNLKPWEFIVVKDKSVREAVSTSQPYVKMAANAPLVIVVCANMKKEYKGFWVQDCSAAMQNLWLAAHAKGIGGVWCGAYPLEETVKNLKTCLKLPDEIIPFGIFVAGYPDHEPKQPDRFDAGKIHINAFGGK